MGIATPPGQGFVEPARDHLIGKVRIEHDVVALVRQVQMVVEQATIAVSALTNAGNIAYALHYHWN
ncbi:hypothetical protein D3C79_901590 [compost metagenome]